MPRALLVERERWCEARLCLLAHRSHTYLLMSDKPSKMLLFCNDVVWDGQSHHAAAEMLKESSPGSELWCATNLWPRIRLRLWLRLGQASLWHQRREPSGLGVTSHQLAGSENG